MNCTVSRSSKPLGIRDQPYFDRPYSARPMLDRRLADAKPARRGQHGHEAVQLAVEPNLVNHVAAKRLQAAVVVVQLDAGEPADQAVEHLRRPPLVPGIVAIDLPAADDVEPFVELGEQLGNFGGTVLQVGVHRDDHLAGRPRRTPRSAPPPCRNCGESGCPARADPRSASCSIVGPRAVRRAVVDQHDLQVVAARRGHVAQLAMELLERARFVEHGNNDADHTKSG